MPRADKARPVFRRRLWVRMLGAYLLPVGLIVSAMGFMAYRAARLSLEGQLGESLMAMARTAAGQVGKPRALRLAPGDEQSRTYARLRQKLADLKQSFDARSIYLFDEQERALIDSDGWFAVGEPIAKLAADRAELAAVFAGHSRSSLLFEGQDGRIYKTGFAPVRVAGQVVAAVAVDGSAAFFGPLADLRQTLFLVGLAALLATALVTLAVSRRITRPIGRLASAAGIIERGELAAEIVAESQDEIGLLARSLDQMRLAIWQRDRQLQMMLAGIAHEVRNPLGGMSLFVGLLKEELAGQSEAESQIRRIETELGRLEQVVSDFLDFARKRPLELIPWQPKSECEQLGRLLEPDLQKAGLGFELTVDAELLEVRVDGEKVRRALLNLLRNAIQASPAESTVWLSVARKKGWLEFVVRDQGPGVAEELRERIFEPFYTSRQRGTGLGLSLVRKIAEGHGGTVELEAKEFTTFILRLPLGLDDGKK